MKRSSIIEARRMHVNPLVRQRVDLSFQIVDRIHEILTSKGLKQKDLASASAAFFVYLWRSKPET